MAKSAKAAKKAPKKKDGGKQAAKDKAKKAASATKGTKAVKAGKGAKAPKAVEAEQARRVISEQKLQVLSRDVQRAMDQSAAAGGVAGELISTAVKKEGLNAPAFRIAHRLKRVGDRDPNKLRILLDDLDYYRDCLKLDDLAGDSLLAPRAGAQDAGEGEEGDDDPKEPAESSVVSFPEGQRPAA